MKKQTINGYRLMKSDDMFLDYFFRLSNGNHGLLKNTGKHDNKLMIFSVCIVLLYSLSACTASRETPNIVQPVSQTSTYQEPAVNYPTYGSLFDSSNARYLYEDTRARRVGDIVTVNVVESSTGTQSAKTSTSGETTASLGVNSFLGKTDLWGIPIGAASPLLDLKKLSEFEGDGSTSRNNTITATLAARVISVMPNGNMQIEAVRETKINNETQFMVVSGIIRGRDISADNSIASTRIANAKIEYYGQGVLSAQQKPGWLMRFLDYISPF